MSGVLKLEGTNIATGDGNGAVTINNAALGSAVTVPASVGGVIVLLEKYTADNSVTNKIFDLGNFSETFNQYKIVINKLLPATDNRHIFGRLGSSTSNIDSSGNYKMTRGYSYYAGTSSTNVNSYYGTDIFFSVTNSGSGTGKGLSGEMLFYSPRDSSTWTTTHCHTVNKYYDDSIESQWCGALHKVTQDDRAIQIFADQSSNLGSGTLTLYGIRDA